MGFREYFVDQADLADDLYERGFGINCYMIATTALDALAEIWESDFPTDAARLRGEFCGTVPGASRMSRLVRTFAGADRRTALIAVIRFAEDAMRFAPGVAPAEVAALLAARQPEERGTRPPAHKDVDITALAQEAPTLLSNAAVRRLAEEYHYPGLLYGLYRCPMVHTFGWSKQAQGFARGEEVSYMRLHPDSTSIGFGPRIVTNWLRATLDGYLGHCSLAGIEPAKNFNPGRDQEQRLQNRWSRV